MTVVTLKEFSEALDENNRLTARIAELETALRSCLQTCLACGTFATWNSRETCQHAYRPTFCDSCKAKRETETYTDGRLVGKLVYGEWQRLARNIELTRIYAASAAPPQRGAEGKDGNE